MNKMMRIYGMAIFAAFLIFSANSFAAETVKIGYVEIKEVFSGYGKAKEAEDAFKKDVEEEQEKISKLEADIKSMQAEFEQKKDILQQEERAKKEAEIREKVQEFSMLWSGINKSLDAKRRELEDRIFEEIQKEIKIYGENKGFTVILDSNLVLYGHSGINITGEIIEALNKKDKR